MSKLAQADGDVDLTDGGGLTAVITKAAGIW